jgi:phage terminase large subunit-like protein
MASGPDYSAVAIEYAQAAVKDRKGRTYCKWVRLAAKRFLADLKKKSWAYEFSVWHVDDVCGFIEKLPHIEGRWESDTIVLVPAQVFILANVFGWRRKSDGGRRFEVAYIELARKNAKSALSSGVALYCLTCDDEPAPQIKCAATTGDQARIVFDVARKMTQKTPALRKAFGLEILTNALVCHPNGGNIRPINAKASTQDGLNPHLSIIDELHAHKDRGLFDVLKSSSGARDNALAWYITTAGYNLTGVCYEQRKLVTKILEGMFRAEHYFGIIFTLDEGDDEFDESVWIKANPLLGITPKIEKLRSYATEAKYSPDSLGEFKTKRMNMWLSAKGGYFNMTSWKACGCPVDLDELESQPCAGGLDLAAVSDICAFHLVWRVGGRLKVWGRYYLPEDVVRPRTEKGNVPYQVWADQGLLTLTPGDVTDYAYIEQDIFAALDRFNVSSIAYDPWNARDLVNRLTEREAPMVEFRQGIASYNGPMKELDRVVKAGLLDHGGDPILAWMASNLVARKDVNENVAPDRKSSEEKIDGIVATLMGLGTLMVEEDKPVPMLAWA